MNKEICWAPERASTAKIAAADKLRPDIEAFIASGGQIRQIPNGMSGNDNRSFGSSEYARLADKNNKRGKPSKKAWQDVSSLFGGER